jgi:hypothetical protein
VFNGLFRQRAPGTDQYWEELRLVGVGVRGGLLRRPRRPLPRFVSLVRISGYCHAAAVA